MKILFLARSMSVGGAERQLVLTAIGLKKINHNVKIAVFYAHQPLEVDLKKEDIPLIYLEKASRWDLVFFFIRLFRTVIYEKPDVLYSFLNVPNVLGVLIKFLFPGIKLVWGIRASDMDLSKYDLVSKIGYKVECALSLKTDLIICNSYAGRNYSKLQGFPNEKMIVIPNGVDSEVFKPSLSSRNRIRQEWGVHKSNILIGIVARLDPMKDHVTFFKAASKLIKTNPNVVFVVVGEGTKSYEDQLKEIVSQLRLDSQTIWAGARQDMPDIYNALDICCSSSLFGEGFSNSIAEAMLCGVPCVVTDVGDSAILIEAIGKAVQPGSPDKLFEALALLISQLTPSLSEACRYSIMHRFSVEKMVLKTSNQLFKITGRI